MKDNATFLVFRFLKTYTFKKTSSFTFFTLIHCYKYENKAFFLGYSVHIIWNHSKRIYIFGIKETSKKASIS